MCLKHTYINCGISKQDALQDQSACWGYEKNCDRKKIFGFPVCTKADSGWCLFLLSAHAFY